MRTRTRKAAAPETSANQVYRLTDMIVEEVSAVDRPANKRPFLVVKSASTPMVGEVVPGPTGELVVTKAPEDTSTTPATSQPEPTSPEAPIVPSDTNPENAPLGTPVRLAPETKAEFASRIDEAAKQLEKLRATVAAAEEVPGLTDIPSELVDGFSGLAAVLTSGVAKADVEKGRKQISIVREGKIRAAHEALAQILSELEPAPAGDASPAPTEAAPAPAAKSADPVPAPESVVKRDVVLAGLVGMVERLTATVQKHAEAVQKQGQRIESFERMRPASNAQSVDASTTSTKKRDERDVSWPSDMNGRGDAVAPVGIDFTSR